MYTYIYIYIYIYICICIPNSNHPNTTNNSIRAEPRRDDGWPGGEIAFG